MSHDYQIKEGVVNLVKSFSAFFSSKAYQVLQKKEKNDNRNHGPYSPNKHFFSCTKKKDNRARVKLGNSKLQTNKQTPFIYLFGRLR